MAATLPTRIPARTLTILLILSGWGCAKEAEPPEHVFVERLGVDTVSVEVFRRTGHGVEGDLLLRSPNTRIAHYVADFDDRGALRHARVAWSTPPENPQQTDSTGFDFTAEGDSVTVERWGSNDAGTRRIAAMEHMAAFMFKIPFASAGLFEHLTQALAATKVDTLDFGLYWAGGRALSPTKLYWQDPQTAAFASFGGPLLIDVDADGSILRWSGESTTMRGVAERVPAGSVDLPALAARFAALDAQGKGMGVASPPARVEAVVGGAHVTIAYSQPAKRGRDIWGALVPYGKVWRTGANAATALSLDTDMMIGDTEVPAGDYTLFSFIDVDDAQLIISQRTGIWGTMYDETADFARIPMSRRGIEQPAERFTIDVAGTDDGSELRLTWDTTQFYLPLRSI